MPELTYKEARKEFLKKYSAILNIIATEEKVDPDTAIDMFQDNVMRGECYGWRDAKKDFDNLINEAKEEVM